MKNSEIHTVSYPVIAKPILLLFSGYVFIWYLQIGYRIEALGAVRFEFLYASLLTVIAMLFTPKIDSDCPLIPYIVLYFFTILAQIPFSHDLNTSWEVFINRIIKFAFLSFFIVAFVRSPKHLKYFLAAFLLACLKMGQEGLVGKISGSLIWENQGIMRLHGSTPMYAGPNSFAGMALGTLPFVYYMWPFANRYVKLILFSIAILSLNIIVYSGSRTGYVGLFVFITYMIINSDKKKKLISRLALLAAVIIPLLSTDYIGRFDSIFTGKDKEGQSIEERIQILNDAWQIFKENPLGVGVAAFPKVRMERFGRFQDTHNLYFQIATNLGIQGLIIASMLIYKLLRMLKEIRIFSQTNLLRFSVTDGRFHEALCDDLKFMEACALATSSFIIVRLALGLFGMDLYEIYWWFSIGITIALYSMMGKLKESMHE